MKKMKKMKNVYGLLLAFLMVLVISSCEKEKEEIVGVEQVPTIGQTFLKDHFGAQKVVSVKKEKEGSEGTEYEARLDNGVTVKFDKDGNWKDVDAPNNMSLPTTFVLKSIVNYVEAEYPNAGINSIDKERQGFDVELTTDLDLVFDTEGNFVRIDP